MTESLMMPNPTIFITSKQVQSQLAKHGIPIDAQAIRRWARENRLPCWRSPTGRVLFDSSVIQRLLESSAAEPASVQ